MTLHSLLVVETPNLEFNGSLFLYNTHFQHGEWMMQMLIVIWDRIFQSAYTNSAPTGQIAMKFDVRVFFETLSEDSGFIKIWQD